MENKTPFLEQHQKIFIDKISLWKKHSTSLREKFDIKLLNSMQKDIHKSGDDFKNYGLIEAAEICKNLEIDLISKEKNAFITDIPASFYDSLDQTLEKLEAIISSQKGASTDSKQTQTQETPSQEISSQEAGKKAPKKEEKKKKVVIVDDDEDILNLLDHEFKEAGFEVEKFKNGTETLAYISNPDNLHDVFLLILDRMLPDMDGLDILKQFVEKSPVKIPVLIISGMTDEKDVVQGLQEGAVDYLTKPFSVFMLMQKAMNLLKSR